MKRLIAYALATIAVVVIGMVRVVEMFHYPAVIFDVLPASLLWWVDRHGNSVLIGAVLIILVAWAEYFGEKRGYFHHKQEPKQDHHADAAPAATADDPHAPGEPGAISGTYPRLAVDVGLLQDKGWSLASGVVLTNVGNTEAHSLHINDMLVSGCKVTFPDNVSVLPATDKTRPITPTIHGVGPMQMHDLMGLMADDWDTQNRLRGEGILDILIFPASATYEDHRGRKFLASWQFEFHIWKYRSWRDRQKRHTDKWLPDTIGPYVSVPKVETKLLS